ncbi:MAG: hypothetical protein LQ346_000947 [Caloplaca aetnensis]|nr:MAG: hypothetical protein LQ346_000947 [Caloplaca aetnensis]
MSPRSVLYQNEDKSISLIDIPCSISEAQGTAHNPCVDLLYSSPPLEKPYPSIEPRSKKAKEEVGARLLRARFSDSPFPQALLLQGLAKVRAEYRLEFCSKRKTTSADCTSSKRKRHKSGDTKPLEDSDEQGEKGRRGTQKAPIALRAFETRKPLILPSFATVEGYRVAEIARIANTVVSNPFQLPALLDDLSTSEKYRIPPLSVFILSTIGRREASVFSESAYKFLPEPSMSAAPGQFDFILLDPPWDNKSARRSRQYQTQRKADEDPLEILEDTVGKHIAPGGVVACWITNKQSVRDSALQAFETWDVELVEEWAWLKTTVHGDPICAIDGLMRRPYEILLIGRHMDLAIAQEDNLATGGPKKYRLIVGVPDLHSRKPCLKTLIEPMMKNSSSYRALEIFARNLTAGWWSWGDEVLKYNRGRYWTKDGPHDDIEGRTIGQRQYTIVP